MYNLASLFRGGNAAPTPMPMRPMMGSAIAQGMRQMTAPSGASPMATIAGRMMGNRPQGSSNLGGLMGAAQTARGQGLGGLAKAAGRFR